MGDMFPLPAIFYFLFFYKINLNNILLKNNSKKWFKEIIKEQQWATWFSSINKNVIDSNLTNLL